MSAAGAVPVSAAGAVRVAVLGAGGRMGAMACAAVEGAEDLQLVARVGRDQDPVAAVRDAGAQVALDLTVPEASRAHVPRLAAAGCHVVVGTSGWDAAALADLERSLQGAPEGTAVLVVPNFALGAVLLVRFAAAAAPWFTSVEVVEAHHPAKLDAPSGTAVRTAELVAAARERAGVPAAPDATTTALDGARGAAVAGVPVHSLRLAGVTASQEVRLGNAGEQLVLRHDATDREAYAPGVLLALRGVASRPGLLVGLEHHLDL